MSKKNTILLIIFLILLGLGFFYQLFFVKHQLNKQKEPTFLAGLDLDIINSIEIDQPNKDKVILVKDEQDQKHRWRIKKWPTFFVNEDDIKDIFQKFEKLSKHDLILASRKKNRQAKFQVDVQHGILVKLFNKNNVIASIIVGKNTRDYNYTYFSQPGEDKTYMTSGNMYGLFSRSEWRDKTIFKNDSNLVNKLRFQYQNHGFTVEKKNGKWMFGKLELNYEKVDKIAKIMSNLTTVKFPKQSFDHTGLEKNKIIVQATGQGINNTLMIGNIFGQKQANNEYVENNYFAKRADSDNIYLINERTVKTLQTSIDKLKSKQKSK